MAMWSQASLALAVFVLGTMAGPQGGPPGFENLPEECRPKRPEPGQQREECCQLPRPVPAEQQMRECAESLGMSPPGPPPADGDRPGKPPGPPRKPCMDECIFEKKGYLTADKQLNAAEISSKYVEEMTTDAAWKPIVEEAVKSCLQTTTGPQHPDATCKSGAMEFKGCVIRAMFLNCPSGLTSSSETCTAERALIEKCPNLVPMPPHPPRPN